MDDVLKRFLAAFNDIETALRRFCKLSAHTRFYELVEKASKRHSGVERYALDLREFGDLRNAIMHGFHDDKAMATPYLGTVLELETIRDRLRSPPKLGATKIRTNVFVCSVTDKVGAVTKTMFAKDFSQVPAYRGLQLVRVLNTDMITRWLSARMEENLGILEEESVGDVLTYAVKGQKHVVLSENGTVFDALQAFEKGFRTGCGLDAIVMTPTGKHNEMPSGIATAFDIPVLQSLVGFGSI